MDAREEPDRRRIDAEHVNGQAEQHGHDEPAQADQQPPPESRGHGEEQAEDRVRCDAHDHLDGHGGRGEDRFQHADQRRRGLLRNHRHADAEEDGEEHQAEHVRRFFAAD